MDDYNGTVPPNLYRTDVVKWTGEYLFKKAHQVSETVFF